MLCLPSLMLWVCACSKETVFWTLLFIVVSCVSVDRCTEEARADMADELLADMAAELLADLEAAALEADLAA